MVEIYNSLFEIEKQIYNEVEKNNKEKLEALTKKEEQIFDTLNRENLYEFGGFLVMSSRLFPINRKSSDETIELIRDRIDTILEIKCAIEDFKSCINTLDGLYMVCTTAINKRKNIEKVYKYLESYFDVAYKTLNIFINYDIANLILTILQENESGNDVSKIKEIYDRTVFVLNLEKRQMDIKMFDSAYIYSRFMGIGYDTYQKIKDKICINKLDNLIDAVENSGRLDKNIKDYYLIQYEASAKALVMSLSNETFENLKEDKITKIICEEHKIIKDAFIYCSGPSRKKYKI